MPCCNKGSVMGLSILWFFALCLTVGASKLHSEGLMDNLAELIDILSEQSYLDVATTDSSEQDSTDEFAPETLLNNEEVAEPSGNEYPVSGTPGVDYPGYDDIPDTSFTCLDKPYVPGLYADMETGCQVFHVCWPRMRESFLCPIGTTFNQAILACDYWYITNCSLTQKYYIVNAVLTKSPVHDSFGSIIHALTDKMQNPSLDIHEHRLTTGVKYEFNFMPVKAKVTPYSESPEEISKPEAEPRIGMLKMNKFSKAAQPVTLKHLFSIGKLLKQLAAEIKATPKFSMVYVKLLSKLAPELIAKYPVRSNLRSAPIADEDMVQISIILLFSKLVVIASELLTTANQFL